MKIRFILMFIVLSVLIIYKSLGQEKKDTVNHAEWHVQDVTNGVDVGYFTTDSVEFIPDFNASGAIIRFYYTDFHGSTLSGKYAIAINIKGFGTPGVYQLGKNEGRWRAMDGTVVGLSDNDFGQIRILYYDPVQKIVSGDFEFDATAPLTTGGEVHYKISSGLFKMGWQFILMDGKNAPLREIPFLVSKVIDKNPLNNVLLGEFTTSKQGKLCLGSTIGVKKDDRLIFERYVDTIKAVKTTHEDVDDIMYIVKLDNASMNPNGNIIFDTLKNSNVIDTVKMEHTTIMYNLTISVEWDAKRIYLDNLYTWFLELNNYMYDVFDGQCMLNKIAIYDNKKYWNDADVFIFASNMEWPRAVVKGKNIKYNGTGDKLHLKYPKKFYGGWYANTLNSAKSDWMELNLVDNFRGYVHEFGHYAIGFYDEYCDENSNGIHFGALKDFNFGFMDSQYLSSGEFSHEMSNIDKYQNGVAPYTVTAQWVTNKMDCWSYFKKEYEMNYGKGKYVLFCPIIKPSERKLQANKIYLPGPNEYGYDLDWDVSKLLKAKIVDFDGDVSGDFALTVPPYQDDNFKISMYQPSITLVKSNKKQIRQGQAHIDDPNNSPTGYDRKAIVLGVSQNDEVRFESTVFCLNKNNMRDTLNTIAYNGKIIVDNIGESKKDSYPDILINASNTKLMSIDSSYRYINSWKYNSKGNIELNHYSKINYPKSPFIEIESIDNSLITQNLNYYSNENIWKATITDSLYPSGTNWFNFYFKNDSSFFSSENVSLSNFDSEIYAPQGLATLHLDTSLTGVNNVAIFSTQFPPLRDGIDPKAKNPSKVFSLATYPNGNNFDLSTRNFLTIRYFPNILSKSQESSLKVFKWNEIIKIWEIIGGDIDTAQKTVTALIPSPGVFTLFTTNQINGINDNIRDGGLNIKVTPSVIDNEAFINVYSDKEQRVKIGLYDLMGRELVNIHEGAISSGNEMYKLYTSDLPIGVYFIRIIGENGFAVAKVLKSR